MIENVTLGAWINARAVTSGTVTATDVTIDFVNNSYSGDAGFNPAITYNTPGCVSVSGLTVEVDANVNFNEQVLNEFLPDGTTVRLNGNVALDKTATIKRNNITLDLNGYTLSPADTFAGQATDNSGNLITLEGVTGFTLENGALKSSGNTRNLLNAYQSSGVIVRNMALDHTAAGAGAPLIVNSSDVTVEGTFALTTGVNSWYGVNVDNKYAGASLTFADGVSATLTDNRPQQVIDLMPIVVLENSGTGAPAVVNKPENAGLVTDENGNFVPAPPTTPEDKPAEKVPETGDSMVGIAIAAAGALLGAACIFLFSRRRSSSC